ncbi:MAG: hypothetical protein WCC17_13915 [Candidatus Nitrosopolaris sp.]|jgi:hypothetical protein
MEEGKMKILFDKVIDKIIDFGHPELSQNQISEEKDMTSQNLLRKRF